MSKTLSCAQLAYSLRQKRAASDHPDSVGSEPIAVVGMGCRLPGGIASPEQYWTLLETGGITITNVPNERWDPTKFPLDDPHSGGTIVSHRGGFLQDVDRFDPAFFGIAPREAANMDPQQRLLLEVAWEAFWDAGYAPEQLAGSVSGIFVAAYGADYARLLLDDAAGIGPNTCSGISHSMASGRLAFLLDLRGPAVTVDTACSSSLVSVHLAVQSLRARECRMALAGGVSLQLSPEHYLCLSKLGMLSPDGRCHTFDAAANGFVPGEGCGLIVLKRLTDALADGDRIRAVIRGTAVNQDGRTQSLTAPNGLAQRDVIKAALENGRVQAQEIGYVETHGTGTTLGDPIEVEALLSVLSVGETACRLGAVKTNLGHLEAASGIAGLIKTALVLEREQIPPNAGFQTLSPHIHLPGTRFRIPTELEAWRRGPAVRFAGVSSFGFSGTNAHVVMEEAPRIPETQQDAAGPFLLTISARNREALESYSERFAGYLESTPEKLDDVCRAAAQRRAHYEERLAVVGGSAAEMATRLRAVRSPAAGSGTAVGRAPLHAGKVAFVFCGQGSQWGRMGWELQHREPVFRQALEKCDARIRELAGWSLLDVLAAGEDHSLLGRTEHAQPAIFSIQVALCRLWNHWGVRPSVIIGHSVGEIAAACVAGVLTLEDGIRIAVVRGRVMEGAAGKGRMATVSLPYVAVRDELPASGGRVSVAAMNSPVSTVVAGDTSSIEQLVRNWAERGVETRLLPVDYAFHCAHMDPYAGRVESELGHVSIGKSEVTLFSTVSGKEAGPGDFDASYWRRNVRQPVLFGECVERAIKAGVTSFVEIGPHPVLRSAIAECTGDGQQAVNVVPSLRRHRNECASMLEAAGRLHTLGHSLRWIAIGGAAKRRISLPPYPYQRQRYWPAVLGGQRPESHSSSPSAVAKGPDVQSLLGNPMQSPALRAKVWQSEVTSEHPLIRGHVISNECVFPFAGFLEMALAASGTENVVSDLVIRERLVIPKGAHINLQTVLDGDRLEIFSQGQSGWTLHASGSIREGVGSVSRLPAGDDPLSPLHPPEFYRKACGRGLEFGPEYQSIRSLSVSQGEVRAAVEVGDSAASSCRIAPALLDGCLQAMMAASPDDGRLYLPFGIDRFQLLLPGNSSVQCRIRLRKAWNGDTVSADFEITNETGSLVAVGEGLHLRAVRPEQNLFEFGWTAQPLLAGPRRVSTRWVIVGGGEAGRILCGFLARNGSEAEWIADMAADTPFEAYDGLVFLGALESPDPAVLCEHALSVVRGVASAGKELWLVTRDAMKVLPDDHCAGYGQLPVWGLARTAALEYPRIRFVRADIGDDRDSLDTLAAEIAASSDEHELAIRGKGRYIGRVSPLALMDDQCQRIAVHERGSLDNLAYEPCERRSPAAAEIEVEVETSALNFRDVLNALGKYPGVPGPLGLEFCGRVSRTGSGVTRYRVGDRVFGLSWGSFSRFVTVHGEATAPVPASLDGESAVTLPNAFATAWHCLKTVGQIRPGERVLIHSGAGGVGLMAVQIALRAGAEVIATAGSIPKRDYLRSIGVQHVFDSRTLDFTREVLALTQGRGVDLVLNSLSGEFIAASLSVVAPSGRFVEIGKTGIWDRERVEQLGRSIAYEAVDLGPILDDQPAVIGGYLEEMLRQVSAGDIKPLPTKVFAFRDAKSAFRYMAQARHTGKVVLRHDHSWRTEGTWLLTGGLGALGIETARWLASRGASRIVLIGRNEAKPEARAAIAALQSDGIHVDTHLLDVADRERLQKAVASLDLCGVVHLAGVLADAVMERQNRESIQRAFRAKVNGAQNLHELAANARHFLLFSSAASLLGSPGQANYAAANGFLDGLAAFRNARGLPALAVNWGSWAGKGMAASVKGRRTMECLGSLEAHEYFALLERALHLGASNVAILSADWNVWSAMPGRSRTVATVARAVDRPNAEQPPPESIAKRLAAMPANRRRTAVIDYLRSQVARILGLDEGYLIDEQEPLMKLGMDSLMAVELRNTLVQAFEQPLGVTLLFDCPTLSALAGRLLGPGEPSRGEAPDVLFDEIAELSDEEAELELARQLEEGQ